MGSVCAFSRSPSLSFSHRGCAQSLKLSRNNCKLKKYLLDHNTSDSFPQAVCLVVDAVKDFHDSFRSIAVLLEMIKPLGRPVFFPVIAILVLEQHFCLICIKTIS